LSISKEEGGDLAQLYGVTVGRLNEAVKRNEDRFPSDFMFQLTKAELDNLKSQIAISSSTWGGRRHAPYVFTEQGVAMLSSVLRSKRAIEVNIAVMRTFVCLLARDDQFEQSPCSAPHRSGKEV
jgi:hypothetical protein